MSLVQNIFHYVQNCVICSFFYDVITYTAIQMRWKTKIRHFLLFKNKIRFKNVTIQLEKLNTNEK